MKRDLDVIKQYVELYRASHDMLCAHSAPVMNTLREQAYHALETQGLPTRKVEAYRYTDIPALFAPDYGLNLRRLNMQTNPRDAYRCEVPGLKTQLFYIINDQLWENVEEESGKVIETDSRVRVCSLRDAAMNDSAFVKSFYGKLASVEADAVNAVNTMLAQDGLLIHIPSHCEVDETIQIINLLRGDVDLMVNRRVLIIIEAGAKASLLFCDHHVNDHTFLTTQVMEVYVGEGASLDIYDMEETHADNHRVSNCYVSQAADSRVRHHVITLTGGTTRNHNEVIMQGEGAECVMNGCVIADRQQHVDNHTLIRHEVAHCHSEELYKYVLDEQATGAFAGRILVSEEAQQTDARMTNQNLLTNHEARMYTQPELEIYADDVKCAHGSTVGQLNDAALFYMRQRGIPLKEARLLLEQAFINEVVDRIPLLPLRERLRLLVEKRFRGELNKCTTCRVCR